MDKVTRFVQLQKFYGEAIVNIFPRTSTMNVVLEDEETSLSNFLATLATKESLSEDSAAAKAYTDQKIADLIDGAPETLDTLKEIADWIKDHGEDYEALIEEVQNLAAGKVDKVDGKELSANDLTDELLAKLQGIAENANLYVHPDTHSATMITETNERQFVTDEEKTKIAESGRILIGDEMPDDMTAEDVFMKIL